MEKETLMLVGGQASGRFQNVDRGIKSIRLPVFAETVLPTKPYDETPTFKANYEIYERRQYTDANKITERFMVLQSLSDEQAAAELYLLGVLNVDENYESNGDQ